MITKKIVNGKLYRSGKIVESFRKNNNKFSHKIIRNLGPIRSEQELEKFKEFVEEIKKGNELIKISEISLNNSKIYGIFYVVSSLFEKYNVDNILKKYVNIGRSKFDSYNIIKALIINRIENPMSKNKAFAYIKKDYPFEIDCQLENLYSSIDTLYSSKESIEIDLFNQLKKSLNLNLEKVHYDLTSSYFEGKKCEIAFYGYSRDHRGDRKQIVIGLVIVDNIPVYHKVFEGNTVDKSTLISVAKHLKEKFNLKKPTIIADRGLFTQDNVEFLEDEKQNYILGFSKIGNKITEELLTKDVPIINKDKQSVILAKQEIIERNEQKYIRNYILCLDYNTKEEQLETLENVKKYISNELTNLQKQYKKSFEKNKGSKLKYENLIVKVNKIISRNKRLFNINWSQKDKVNGFDFALNNDWYKREQKAAGKFILITNTDESPDKILKSYKDLNDVESSFNCIKNQLEIRPINHYKTNRVQAHVFICVLALLIEKIIERLIKDMTAQKVIDELKRITIAELQLTNQKKIIISKLNIEQNNIINKLGISNIN